MFDVASIQPRHINATILQHVDVELGGETLALLRAQREETEQSV